MFKILKRSYKTISKLNVLISHQTFWMQTSKINFMVKANEYLFKDNKLKYLFLISMVMFL